MATRRLKNEQRGLEKIGENSGPLTSLLVNRLPDMPKWIFWPKKRQPAHNYFKVRGVHVKSYFHVQTQL